MESESSFKSICSLFSSSKLESFSTVHQRSFRQSATHTDKNSDVSNAVDEGKPDEPSRKRRRRSNNSEEWTKSELRALETYRNLHKGGDDKGLREILLPNRTLEEINAQLLRLDESARGRRKSKLEELEREETAAFDEEVKLRVEEKDRDIQRAKNGLDSILGLSSTSGAPVVAGEEKRIVKEEVENVKASMDQILGLAVETEQERKKRELDQLLGLG
jgi:hypothetical protein